VGLDSSGGSADRFEILRPIAQGGMGQVLLARDRRLNRQVAIKYLRSDKPDPQWRTRLHHEAEHLAQLNHLNIVQIYDIQDIDGEVALVMEYVDGQNLRVHLAEHPVDYSQRLAWLTEIAGALVAAHASSIVHCDLKAENVLISAEGVAKVADFGIARQELDPAVDLLAFGQLAASVLADCPDITLAAADLLERLQDARQCRQLTAQDIASAMQRLWLESTQEETVIVGLTPGVVSQTHAKLRRWGVLAVVLAAVLVAGISLFREPAPRDYLAIATPTIVATGLSAQQQLYMRSLVQQSLQQLTLESEQHSLVSLAALGPVEGSPLEWADALGAGEVITSQLDCGVTSCQLTLQRLGIDDAAVITQATLSLLVDAPLESAAAIDNEWLRLFPGSVSRTDTPAPITAEVYSRFLQLYAATHTAGERFKLLLPEVVALIDQAPGFMPLYLLYGHLAMDVHDQTGELAILDELERMLGQARGQLGDSIPLQTLEVELALEREQLEPASRALEKLAQLGADARLLQELHGDIESHRGDYAAAEQHYLKAVAIKPSRSLYYKLAINYYFARQMPAARQVLELSLASYPAHPKSLNALGMVALDSGELELAQQSFARAIALKPETHFYSNLGLVYLLAGDYDAAMQALQVPYEQGVRGNTLLLNMADVLSLLGESEAAAELYRGLVRLDTPENFSVPLDVISQAYAHLGFYEQAIATLRRFDSAGGDQADSAFNAALVYTLAGQHIAALVEVDRALSSGIDSVWFELPWFDALCEQEQFTRLMTMSGSPQRCVNRD